MSHEVTAPISSTWNQLNKCGTRVLCASRHLRGEQRPCSVSLYAQRRVEHITNRFDSVGSIIDFRSTPSRCIFF
jgi:hypothetical protein